MLIIKHDNYLNKLFEKLKNRYDFLLKNVPLYSKRGRLIAEIDIIGIKDDYCDVYEVKCSFRITKAKRQLTKIRKLLSEDSKVRKSFFFCGESQTLITV